jgi:hypothetical protein
MCPDQQPGEPLHVDRVCRHLEHIAGCARDHHACGRAQGVAKPSHVGLQRVAGLLGRLVAEYLVNQPVEMDNAAAAQQQRRQQRPLPRPWHHHGPTGHPDLQRPQDAELHLALQSAHLYIAPPGPPVPPAVTAGLVATA